MFNLLVILSNSYFLIEQDENLFLISNPLTNAYSQNFLSTFFLHEITPKSGEPSSRKRKKDFFSPKKDQSHREVTKEDEKNVSGIFSVRNPKSFGIPDRSKNVIHTRKLLTKFTTILFHVGFLDPLRCSTIVSL